MKKFNKIGDFLTRVKDTITIQDGSLYKRVTIKTKHQGILLRDVTVGADIGTKNQFSIKKGQFLLSKIDARYGAFGIVPDELDNAIITGNFWTYDVDHQKVDIEWFLYYTHSPDFIKICEESSTGTTHRKYLKEQIFLNHKIILPSIAEQKYMVQKYKECSFHAEKTKASIQTTAELIGSLKKAILQEAIQGKLTVDWRKQNPDVEPASELLKRIKAEKAQLLKEKKIRKEKPLPPITEEEIPFELPNGWAWCRLGDICQLNPKNSKSDELTCSFIPMKMISEQFGVTPEYEIKKWKEIKKGYTHFQDEDIALAKITPCFENSKAGIMKNLINGFGAGTTEIFILRPYIAYAELRDIIYFTIKSSNFLVGGKPNMTGTSGQQRVPKDYVNNYIIALPPILEQSLIVQAVENAMVVCKVLQSDINLLTKLGDLLIKEVVSEVFKTKIMDAL